MIEKQRLHHLHAIRGWAALFVVIAHAKYPFWSGGQAYIEKFPQNSWDIGDYLLFGIDMLTSFASVFVIVFFVLSGFFIARSIQEKHYSPLFFYGDRIIRIYIPYGASLLIGYFALKAAYMVHPELFHIVSPDRPYNKDIISAYFDLNRNSLQNAVLFLPGESGHYFGMNNPSWSLYFEALFYLIIPLLFIVLKKYWFFYVAAFCYVIAYFIRNDSWLSLSSFILNYSLYFAAGVLLYEMSVSRIAKNIMIRVIRRYTKLILFLSLFFLLASVPVGLLHYKKAGFFLGMIGTVLLIVWILYARRSSFAKRVRRVLINPFSKFLGTISFSMYLIHVPLLVLMYAFWTKISGQLVFYEHIYWIPVLLIIPAGYLFYLLVEKPSLILLAKYKKRFRG